MCVCLGENVRGTPISEHNSSSYSEDQTERDGMAHAELNESELLHPFSMYKATLYYTHAIILATPLISSMTKETHVDIKRRRCGYFYKMSFVVLLSLLLMLLVNVIFVVYYETKPLPKPKETAVLKNKNDTIVAVEVKTDTVHKVSLTLVQQTTQSLNVIDIYSTPCNKLRTHSTTDYSAGDLIINGAVQISFPAYLVTGSTINIHSYVLNASSITVQIELYVFSGLSWLDNFAANLEKSVYRATIYISRPGVQNTSTFINYTATDTDYYFLVVDSSAPIHAEFDIAVNRMYYDPADYKRSCVIQDKDTCELTYSMSKKQCVLAHAVYVQDAQWLPTGIEVTQEPWWKTETVIILMSCMIGVLALSVVFVLAFCVMYYFCKRSPKQK